MSVFETIRLSEENHPVGAIGLAVAEVLMADLCRRNTQMINEAYATIDEFAKRLYAPATRAIPETHDGDAP